MYTVPDDWEVFGRIAASEYRQLVFKALADHPQTPTQIANSIDRYQTHVSRTLRELEEMGLVECRNPNARKGRIYALTNNGDDIYECMDEKSLI